MRVHPSSSKIPVHRGLNDQTAGASAFLFNGIHRQQGERDMTRTFCWMMAASLSWLLLASPAWGQTANKTKPTAAKSTTAQTPTPPKPRPVRTYGNVQKLTEDQRAAEMKVADEAGKDFRKAAEQYLQEVRSMVSKRYRERRKLIVGGYETKIAKLERKEELARQKAIQYFLAFVKKYPDHPKFSPDAMYRLAELFYEEEYSAYLNRSKIYEKDLERFEKKELAEEPLAPKKQFTQTIVWLERVTQTFPQYRFISGAYYLLGYCKEEENKGREAVKYFKLITEKYPKSPQVAESWIRLGEHYFREGQRAEKAEERDKAYKLAKEAYSKVLQFPKHTMFDKALYKLAWVHYLDNEFDQSINKFKELLEFYIEKAKKDGKDEAGDLRQEAIQYIANSLSEERWGTTQKAEEFVRKAGLKKKYSRDVLKQLAQNHAAQNNWDKVVEVNQLLLKLYPLHENNPQVLAEIIRAYEANKNLTAQLKMREQFIEKFGKGSEWSKKNANNLRAQRAVNKILSNNIYRTAIYRHETCNAFRKRSEESKKADEKEVLLKEAIKNCIAAADNYREFLRRFPHHKEAYTLTWYLADSLYFVKKHAEASKYFKKVRDWPGESKYRDEASFSIIDTFVSQVNASCDAKQILRACERKQDLEVKKADKKEGDKKKAAAPPTSLRRKKIRPLPIPLLQRELADAREIFIKKLKNPKDKRAPGQLYLLARIYYAYDHLTKARALLWKFIKTYPTKKLVQQAGDTIISSYKREGRLNDMLSAINKIRTYNRSFKADYKDALELGIAYNKAKELKDQGKLLLAAQAYEKAVNKNRKHKDAPAALWNAALLYEEINRYGSALRIYERIVNEYPRWDKADDALFLVAYNAEKFFNFPVAISRYMKLVNDSSFSQSKKRPDALYNAGLLLENMQRYQEAAKAFERYSKEFSQRPDSADVAYRATLVYKRMKRWDEQVRSLESFIRRYESNPKQAQNVMTAYGEIMNAYEKMNKPWSARRSQYNRVIRAFERLSSKMTPVARDLTKQYPAKAAYQLAIRNYNAFASVQVKDTNPKRQAKALKRKIATYAGIQKELGEIAKYQSPRWLLCALYKIAAGKQNIVETVQKMPLPKIRGVKWDEDAIDTYKEQLDEKYIQPLEDQAKKLYQKTIAESKRLHFENNCTDKAYIALNRMDPNVPLPKRTHEKAKFEPLSPMPLFKSLKPPKKATKSKKTGPKGAGKK